MKMKLNQKKSKIMIFNFQFSTRILKNQELLETVKEATILGLVISSDLSWRKNTDNLIRKANTRMIMIRNLVEFPIPRKDIVLIYCQYIRVLL